MQRAAEHIAHELDACYKELKCLGVEVGLLPSNDKLIITTGDISDVDGFFALAKYATTGADVLFVMNYPAWVGCERNENRLANGLGFTYTRNEFMQKNFEANSAAHKEKRMSNVMQNAALTDAQKTEEIKRIEAAHENTCAQYYRAAEKLGFNLQNPHLHTTASECMRAFDKIAFTFAQTVWTETTMLPGRAKGTLYYCRGGVNAVSPFSLQSTKNEMAVYAEQINNIVMSDHVGLTDGAILKTNEVFSVVRNSAHRLADYTRISDFLLRYNSICMDFNGSMAFLDGAWISALEAVTARKLLKGIFVMGGCLTTKPLETIRHSFLNRMDCATMNQLYHPGKTAQFFDFIRMQTVSIYVVPNTIVNTIPSDDPIQFLRSNGIRCSFLESLASSYYNSPYFPGGGKKPFDLYTAVAIEGFLDGQINKQTPAIKMMWYDSIYGCTLVSDIVERRELVTQMKRGLHEGWQADLIGRLRLACMHVHIPTFHLDGDVLRVDLLPVD
jgi:hypothetical protein